jgi:hypothetical protein
MFMEAKARDQICRQHVRLRTGVHPHGNDCHGKAKRLLFCIGLDVAATATG